MPAGDAKPCYSHELIRGSSREAQSVTYHEKPPVRASSTRERKISECLPGPIKCRAVLYRSTRNWRAILKIETIENRVDTVQSLIEMQVKALSPGECFVLSFSCPPFLSSR
jgi:hypothetical protein